MKTLNEIHVNRLAKVLRFLRLLQAHVLTLHIPAKSSLDTDFFGRTLYWNITKKNYNMIQYCVISFSYLFAFLVSLMGI